MSRWTFPPLAPLTLAGVALVGAAIGGVAIWAYDRHVAPAGAERAQIEGVVHDYVLAHPEILPEAMQRLQDRGMGEHIVVHDYVLAHPEILPEAMQRLQDRESGKAVAANLPAITTPFGDAWIGNPKGDVTLVEYFDYNCGYCRASLPTIAQLVASDPKLRVVFRELPILSPQSRVAARMSLAAASQGKFAKFHDALYAAGPVSDATIAGAASAVGLEAGKSAGFDRTADAEIAKNMETAGKLGVTGTPSWVVGDRVLSGAQPLDELQKAIAAARAG